MLTPYFRFIFVRVYLLLFRSETSCKFMAINQKLILDYCPPLSLYMRHKKDYEECKLAEA